MAQFQIIDSDAPYYTVRVAFSGQEFEQTVVSGKTGKPLQDQLQAYADDYEANWIPAEQPESPTPEPSAADA